MRIALEAGLEKDHQWLEEFDFAAWMPSIVSRADNQDITQQYGSNWGSENIARYLASREPHLRFLKLAWWGSGWLTHQDSRPTWDIDHIDDYTTTEKIIDAAENWNVEVGRVGKQIRDTLSDIYTLDAHRRLCAYGEYEVTYLLQTQDQVERLLASPRAMENVQKYGGAVDTSVSRSELIKALLWQSWSVEAKRLRLPFIKASRVLVAHTMRRLLRSHFKAWKGIECFWLSNCGQYANLDWNGHSNEPQPLMTTKQVPMMYFHNPGNKVFSSNGLFVTGFGDMWKTSEAYGSKPFTVNVNADALSSSEMAIWLKKNNNAPGIIFGGNLRETQYKIRQTLMMLRG